MASITVLLSFSRTCFFRGLEPGKRLTFALQEVEGAEETPAAAARGGLGRRLLSQQLGELTPRQVDESGQVTQHQLCEHLGLLVTELLHKEVGVEDDGGGTAGTGAARTLLWLDPHGARCTSDRDKGSAWSRLVQVRSHTQAAQCSLTSPE